MIQYLPTVNMLTFLPFLTHAKFLLLSNIGNKVNHLLLIIPFLENQALKILNYLPNRQTRWLEQIMAMILSNNGVVTTWLKLNKIYHSCFYNSKLKDLIHCQESDMVQLTYQLYESINSHSLKLHQLCILMLHSNLGGWGVILTTLLVFL